MENVASGLEEHHLLKSSPGDSAFRLKANGAHLMACCKILSRPPVCPCQTKSLQLRPQRKEPQPQGSVYIWLCWKMSHQGFK